ncbi:3406_t:CDS:1, partial [Rhizophagus irregularis]
RKSKDIVVEKESKYYIPNNSEDIDREHTFHFFQKYVFEDIKYQNY